VNETRRRLLRLPSPATIIAMAALVAATAGAATAADRLITGAAVKDGSLTGADVKNKSLTAKDFRGSIRGARGVRGEEGPPGPPGAQGPAGAAGSVGPITTVESDKELQPDGFDIAVASCPAGQLAVSGGFQPTQGFVLWDASRATVGRTQWLAAGTNFSSTDTATIRAVAYCAAVPSAAAVSAAAERADVAALRKQLQQRRR
jgi:hypothetical protein